VSERRRFGYPAAVRAEGMKVSWGGIFGGVLVAVGLLLLLTALGVAVGISAAQPGETEASTLGTGAGLWAGLSLLVAGYAAGGALGSGRLAVVGPYAWPMALQATVVVAIASATVRNIPRM
jgi:hypothetical protein